MYEAELAKIKESVINRYDLSSIENKYQSTSQSNVRKLLFFLNSISEDDQVVIKANKKNQSQNSAKQTRASIYRGVSRNGPKWQVLFMGCKKKEYVGGVDTEEEGARIYDEISIQTHGLKVRFL